MKRFKLALGFLTVIPARVEGSLQPGELGRSAAWFPLVGLLLGISVAGARLLLGMLFPDLLAAVLTVAVWAALTGGLHLDGLADCFDGLLAAVPPARRLEIMKDPRLGTFGGTGLLLHLLVKIGIVMAIPADPAHVWGLFPLVLAPVVGRWLVLVAAGQPMARPGGLGAEFAVGLKRGVYLLAAVLPLALVIAGGWRAWVGAGLAHLIALAAIWTARTRLGGVTGDVLGLVVELGETAAMLPFVIKLFA